MFLWFRSFRYCHPSLAHPCQVDGGVLPSFVGSTLPTPALPCREAGGVWSIRLFKAPFSNPLYRRTCSYEGECVTFWGHRVTSASSCIHALSCGASRRCLNDGSYPYPFFVQKPAWFSPLGPIRGSSLNRLKSTDHGLRQVARSRSSGAKTLLAAPLALSFGQLGFVSPGPVWPYTPFWAILGPYLVVLPLPPFWDSPGLLNKYPQGLPYWFWFSLLA